MLVDAPEVEELLVAIVLAYGEDAISISPVSSSVQFATEWDLLLDPLILGYETMVEIWNFGSVLPEQITESVTSLPDEAWDAVRTLAGAAARSGSAPDGLPLGAPVLDDSDPRLLFQDAQAQLTQPYWEPTLALSGAATLGQLVTHRRDELDVADAELEEVVGGHGWVADLETDRLDVLGALPAASLATIMRHLRIGRSRRLLEIARWTIEAQSGLGGSMARHGAAPGDAKKVEDYLTAFAEELDEPGPRP